MSFIEALTTPCATSQAEAEARAVVRRVGLRGFVLAVPLLWGFVAVGIWAAT